jgi:predicted dehydrogenase
MNLPSLSRRSFLKTASLATTAAALPSLMRGQQASSPNDKLNVAFVGVGGRAVAGSLTGLAGENFVAFCDVDDRRAADTYKKYPGVPHVRDYRRLLDQYANQIDAVAITTPDHMHYPIAVAALQLGKHVFCEKPLTHTIAEARRLGQLAREKNVATQMGNQGHAGDGVRQLKEWVDAGVLGDVHEVHSWTDRPGKRWPQGGLKTPDHSQFIPVVPPTLDWDLWLGIAQPRAYDPAYLPFTWRGYWDFGTGALGDMGCHLLDGAHWALQLDAPTHIEAVRALDNDLTGPNSSVITFRFPARGSLAPLTLKWYDGGLMPPPPPELESTRQLPDNGTLIVGTKATVLADTYYGSVRIIPETKMQELTPTLPAPSIPRVQGGHFAEWIRACKGGPAAGSNFTVSSRLTELCLLSCVAVRARRPIAWDSAAMRVTNLPEANRYLRTEYRPGFGV